MAIYRAERDQSQDRMWNTLRGMQHRFQQSTDWIQSLFQREEDADGKLARQYHFPSQRRVLENITDEGIDILENLGGRYPIPRQKLQELLAGKSAHFQQKVNGQEVEVWRMSKFEPVRLAYSVPSPERLTKVVGVTGFDTVISGIYDRPEGSKGLFDKFIFRGKPISLWDEKGRARMPDEVYLEPMAQLEGGETVTFASKDGCGPSINFTKLPMPEGKKMPRFILAAEKRKAKKFFKTTLSEARRRNLDLLFLVKLSQLGIAKAYFWEDIDDSENPRTRVLIRDSRLNYYNFDNTPLNQGISGYDRIPGCLNVILEYSEGNLETLLKENIDGIRIKDPLLKSLRSLRHENLLTAAVFDITQTGESLKTYGLAIVEGRDIFQCPPGAVSFGWTPKD